MMALNIERIDKIFWLFGSIMPIPENESTRKSLEAIIGGKVDQTVQQFMKLLSLMIKQNPDDAEMWIRFVSQSIEYMQGKSDRMPDTDMTEEELERFWKVYGVIHRKK